MTVEDASHGGSSPLTRGKRGRDRRGCQPWGLIPAHAGKTQTLQSTGKPSEAHPRSRGENSTRPHKRTIFRGSSPLTRGKLDEGAKSETGHGLIPAHAGKTRRRGRSSSMTGAHPRSRGENVRTLRAAAAGVGSSPLTRGKLAEWDGGGVRVGLIPAHAGKTPRPKRP